MKSLSVLYICLGVTIACDGSVITISFWMANICCSEPIFCCSSPAPAPTVTIMRLRSPQVLGSTLTQLPRNLNGTEPLWNRTRLSRISR